VGDYRGDHLGAVFAALDAIGELQGILASASEQCDVAMGAVIGATGAAEVESAQNAMNFIQGARERLVEVFGMTNAAVEELRRYGGGF
jgi:hypothetical protein